MRLRSATVLALLVTTMLALGACGGGPASSSASGAGGSVASVRPSTPVTPAGSVVIGSAAPSGTPAGGEASPSSPSVGATGQATAISTGGHSCALVGGGGVKCWGHNSSGELGNGTTAPSPLAVAVTDLTDATAVAAGRVSTCAIRTAGAVSCWGTNLHGELGLPLDTQGSPVPVALPGVSGARALALENASSCALLEAGTVTCWGLDNAGQLGDGGSPDSKPRPPVQVAGLTDAVAVSVGENTSCAVRTGGGVVCWGLNYGKAPVAVAGVTDATAVAVGDRMTCVLRKSGGVDCWNGNDPAKAVTPVAGLTAAKAISSMYLHACALLADGGVACWGDNRDGVFGDGTTTTPPATAEAKFTAVPAVGVSGSVGVSAGVGTTCAILSSGGALCWGGNYDGNLGMGAVSPATSVTPVPVAGL